MICLVVAELTQEELENIQSLIGEFGNVEGPGEAAVCNVEASQVSTTPTATTTPNTTSTQSDVEGPNVDSTDFALKELRQRLDYLKNLYDIKDQVKLWDAGTFRILGFPLG